MNKYKWPFFLNTPSKSVRPARPLAPGRPRRQRKARASACTPDGPRAGLSQTAPECAWPRRHALSLPTARPPGHGPQRGVEHRYYRRAYGQGLFVSGRRARLARALRAQLAALFNSLDVGFCLQVLADALRHAPARIISIPT